MRPLVSPCYRARSVTDITPGFLKGQGMRAAMLDLDGCLIGYRQGEAAPEVEAWIKGLLTEGLRLCIVSNPGPRSTLAQIASQLGLEAFRGTVPKPLPWTFWRARNYLGVGFSETAMIGDQLLTDMVGGNLMGMLTIWVDAVPGSPEGWLTRSINRRLEKAYRAKRLPSHSSRSPYLPYE